MAGISFRRCFSEAMLAGVGLGSWRFYFRSRNKKASELTFAASSGKEANWHSKETKVQMKAAKTKPQTWQEKELDRKRPRPDGEGDGNGGMC